MKKNTNIKGMNAFKIAFLAIFLAFFSLNSSFAQHDNHENDASHQHDGAENQHNSPEEGHDNHDSHEGGEFNPGEMVDHHIKDSHSWEIFHGFRVHLPVILYTKEHGLEAFSSSNFFDEKGHLVDSYKHYKMDSHSHITTVDGHHVLDVSFTKNVLFMFLNAIALFLIFSAVAKGYKKNEGRAPSGIQSFFEPVILFVKDDIVKPNIGPKYEKFLPFLLTLFFFIWFGNLLGLLPGAANMTGNISVTLVLALFVIILTVANGNKTYWGHILNPLGNTLPIGGKIPLYIVLVPLELIGIITKPFSLTIRLFANITAGHIIILSILGLTFMFKSVFVGVGASLFALVMNMLELFVAVLQAYVFTLLASMYLGQAVEEHH